MTPPPPSIEELTGTLNQILHNQQSFQASVPVNINTLTSELHDLCARFAPPGFTSPFTQQGPNIHFFWTTTMKIDIPRFNGSNPLGWIFKTNQYFGYHITHDDQRLCIASFQWMHSNGQLLIWSAFLHSLENMFAPSLYERKELCSNNVILP